MAKKAFHKDLCCDKVRNLRTSLGLSVKELSEASGVSASYIYDIEAGTRVQVGDGFAHALAQALGVEINAIEKDTTDLLRTA